MLERPAGLEPALDDHCLPSIDLALGERMLKLERESELDRLPLPIGLPKHVCYGEESNLYWGRASV